MRFLLDTNVVSEWVRAQPSASVVAWLAHTAEDDVFMSVITFAELRRGAELLPSGRRRHQLMTWIGDDLALRFDGRILDIDRTVAEAWGVLMARSQQAGRMLGTMDGFLAATAERHDMTLVTRNVRDFEELGLALHDPWRED